MSLKWKMVKKIKNHNLLYKCEECQLVYREKSQAEKCENWCKENKSCNLEITKYAVNKNKR